MSAFQRKGQGGLDGHGGTVIGVYGTRRVMRVRGCVLEPLYG